MKIFALIVISGLIASCSAGLSALKALGAEKTKTVLPPRVYLIPQNVYLPLIMPDDLQLPVASADYTPPQSPSYTLPQPPSYTPPQPPSYTPPQPPSYTPPQPPSYTPPQTYSQPSYSQATYAAPALSSYSQPMAPPSYSYTPQMPSYSPAPY